MSATLAWPSEIRKERALVRTRFWVGGAIRVRDRVAVGNDPVTIALQKSKPLPEAIGHMSFHLPDMSALRKALKHLKRIDADLEDPGDEIGPEAPGSPHMGLWLHDPDGYRWELSVQNGPKD